MINDDPPLEKPSDLPKTTLKTLLSELKYAFIRDNETCLVVIPSSLFEQQEEKLLYVFRKKREVFRWTILDLKGINPLFYKLNIYFEEDDPRGFYLLHVIIEEMEDHMNYKKEVRGTFFCCFHLYKNLIKDNLIRKCIDHK